MTKETLTQEIESIIEQSKKEFGDGNYLKSIKTLEQAWGMLPEPKGSFSESYHIVREISETFLAMREYDKAKEWAERIYNCAIHWIDSGERELLSGKIAFESGELEKAKEFFTVAYLKSDSRCFEDEDNKYHSFFKKI